MHGRHVYGCSTTLRSFATVSLLPYENFVEVFKQAWTAVSTFWNLAQACVWTALSLPKPLNYRSTDFAGSNPDYRKLRWSLKEWEKLFTPVGFSVPRWIGTFNLNEQFGTALNVTIELMICHIAYRSIGLSNYAIFSSHGCWRLPRFYPLVSKHGYSTTFF